ncbi:Protein of unknown function [Gryllus bimaculatus]|nr:Protein of unknown function [Gryllus bimaculatus]
MKNTCLLHPRDETCSNATVLSLSQKNLEPSKTFLQRNAGRLKNASFLVCKFHRHTIQKPQSTYGTF